YADAVAIPFKLLTFIGLPRTNNCTPPRRPFTSINSRQNLKGFRRQLCRRTSRNPKPKTISSPSSCDQAPLPKQSRPGQAGCIQIIRKRRKSGCRWMGRRCSTSFANKVGECSLCIHPYEG